jgi:drug/metabolite transporter (DMT)-like permease
VKPSRHHLVLTAVVVVWAGAFAAIKHLLDAGLSGPEIAAARYLVAAPGFAVAFRLAGGLRGATRAELVRIVAAGLLVVAVYHIALNEGEHFTSSGTAAVIVATAPGMTQALALASGLERFSAVRAMGLAVAFAGVVVVVLLGSGAGASLETAKGPAIVLASPLAFALYNVIVKPLVPRRSPIAVSSAASLAGTVALLPLLGVGGSLDAARGLGAWDWMLVAYLGLVCTLAAYIAWTMALQHLDASRTVAFLYGVPVLAVAIGAVTLGESVTGWLAAGAVLVIGGVALAQMPSRPEASVVRAAHPGASVD